MLNRMAVKAGRQTAFANVSRSFGPELGNAGRVDRSVCKSQDRAGV